MRRPSGVIFDLGDTVLHLAAFKSIAGNKKLLEFTEDALGLTPQDVQLAFDDLARESTPLQDESMLQLGIQSLQRLVYDNLGLTFTLGPLEMERLFWRTAIHFELTDGISEVLDTLEANRITKGILSNSGFTGTILEEELARHDLARRFSFVISTADYGFRKPHWRIFQIAARKMDLAPRDIWFVGDKLEYDIRGALDFGLCPVWYNPEGKPGTLDGDYLEVSSWHEFREKIDLLCAG